jgi:hypothetical protein
MRTPAQISMLTAPCKINHPLEDKQQFRRAFDLCIRKTRGNIMEGVRPEWRLNKVTSFCGICCGA